MSQNFFSPIFMKITTYPNFDIENSKIKNIFPCFFIFIFIFASIGQKCPKKLCQNFFSPIFMKITIYPNFNTEYSKIKPIFANFFNFTSIMPRLVKNGLKNESKIFFPDFHENFCITKF